jgi:predicted aminopeptidase
VSKPINNARLNAIATYHELVPSFHRLLARHEGKWDAFYATLAGMKSWSKERRRTFLEAQ